MDDVNDFRKYANEIYDEISDCGYTKAPSRLLITDKVEVVQSVALHHVILENYHNFGKDWVLWGLPKLWSSMECSYGIFL